MKLSFRAATTADVPVLAEHNVAAAQESEHLVLDGQTALAGVQNVFAHPELGRYFVAQVDGQIAGSLMITYEWRDWHNRLSWWIQSVYTRPEFRRRGVYAAFYKYILALAKSENVHSVRLYADKDNQAARAVYRKLGMHEGEYIIYEHKL
jgi:ribosomal protein S18 acetylase RimI-like enzyme